MSKRKRKRQREEAAPATDATAGPPAEPPSPRRLLPVDVQQKEFRLAFRGYNEQDVDEFLDAVTEELARLHEENKRLIERLEEGGGAGPSAGALIEDAQRRAEEIVREARAQAGALLAAGGGTAPAIGGTDDIRPFLVREREFLQGLASLIQQHAESVKRDAQQVRGSSSAESAPEPAGTVMSGSAGGAVSEPGSPETTEYSPRHVSQSTPAPAPPAPPAPAPVVPELSEAFPPERPGEGGARRDAWAPEPQDDPWAELPQAEPLAESPQDDPWAEVPQGEPPGFAAPAAPSAPAATEALPPAEAVEEADTGVDQTQSWSAPSAPDWEEAVELPLEDEVEFTREVEAPSVPGQAIQQAAFGPERAGDASWSNPFLETGGPAPAVPPPGDLEDDLRPDPISLSGPVREPEDEDKPPPSDRLDAPRDESDEADREESDRSLRELFWGEE